MPPASQKQSYSLISLFEHMYELKTGRKPTLNKYREKWGFQDMIDSIGYDRAVEVIKFYFDTPNAWTPGHLFNNFDRLDESLRKRDDDRAHRAALREQTRLRMEEQQAHES
jgi:hypothetical protein